MNLLKNHTKELFNISTINGRKGGWFVVFYGGGALVVRKQNQLIELFNKYGAISAENAISLDDVGVKKSFVFYRMAARNIFIQCENGKFYVDNQAVMSFMQRRKKLLVVLIVVLVIGAIYYAAGGR